jgi:hypothetical protein
MSNEITDNLENNTNNNESDMINLIKDNQNNINKKVTNNK